MNSKTSVKTRIWTRVPDNCFIIGFRHFHFSFILIVEEKNGVEITNQKTNNSCKLSLGWRNHVSFTFNVIISNAFQSAHNHVTIKSKFVRFLCLKYILQLIHLFIETNAYTNLLEYQLVLFICMNDSNHINSDLKYLVTL